PGLSGSPTSKASRSPEAQDQNRFVCTGRAPQGDRFSRSPGIRILREHLSATGWIWDCRPRKTLSFGFPFQNLRSCPEERASALALRVLWAKICKGSGGIPRGSLVVLS